MAKLNDTSQLRTFIRSKRVIFAFSVGILSVILLFLLALVSYAYSYRGEIFPNTYVGGFQLGGKTQLEAESIIKKKSVSENKEFTLTISDHDPVRFPLAEVSLTYDPASIGRSSFLVGRRGGLARKISDLSRSLFRRNTVPAVFHLDEGKFNEVIERNVGKIGTQAADARIVLDQSSVPTVEPAKTGFGLTKKSASEAILSALSQMRYETKLTPEILSPLIVESDLADALIQTQQILAHAPVNLKASDVSVEADAVKVFSWISYTDKPRATSPVESPVSIRHRVLPYASAASKNIAAELNMELLKNYIGTIAVSVNNDPINAELRAVDGQIKVIKEHTDGEKLIIDEAVALVISTFSQTTSTGKTTITLPIERIVADIRSDTIAALGIKELIGQAETNFKGSPANRVHNINTGARFLTGAVVPKGQEFSTVKTLGKVDGSTGYLPELVIKEDRTIPEYGGGLCQVSTTLFRSVLNAGLKVTERSNHSYRVSYYEPPVGLDATIYLPKPDFKFLNDTPGYILVQSKIEGTKITFELYGTKDGRVSSIAEPVVTDVTNPPEPSYTETDTLPKGEVKQIEKPHPGSTAVATYTVMRDGQEINKQVFRSRYKPWQARFLVGTKE